jgi:general secretion pathway protein K
VFCKRPKKIAISTQNGIVLLAAMLVVMVATAIIVAITHGEAFSIRKTARIQTADRANLHALALEDWARIILIEDSKNSNSDHLQEDWATKIPGIPIEGGFLTGSMEDEQAKFNINNLLSSVESINQFKRLCDNLGVDTTFINALLDWIDSDSDIRYPDGAEEFYETYRVANRELSDISELMLVKNMTADIYNELRPYISALPAPSNINVNTMSKTIFKSLDVNLNEADEDTFIAEREDTAFEDVSDFITRLQLTVPTTGLAVSTSYFYAHGVVVQGEQSVNFNTLINRDSNGKTTIISRSLGGF